MDQTTLTVIISLIVAIGGILTSRAAAAGAITDAAMKLVAPLKLRIEDLEKELKQVKEDNDKWRRGAYILLRQITQLGCVPNWKPEEEKGEEK
jgi:hypothetical protein